tara:strand:+ start:2081 stop:2602 length:522 start_codon:yes stop_codon:yes gene_type:complete
MKKSNKLFLKELKLKIDITAKYRDWLNDKKVNRYTEQRYKTHSISDVRNFVKEKFKSKSEFLYGIFILRKNLKEHIGNIKLGPINFRHKSAEISYFIGEKDLWGKGFATMAIKEVIKKARKKRIKKLRAGLYENNVASKKVLIKNGFKVEGQFKSEVIYRGKRISIFWLGKII